MKPFRNPDPLISVEHCLVCRNELRPLIDVLVMDGMAPKDIHNSVMNCPAMRSIESHMNSGHVRIDKDGFRSLLIRGMQDARRFMDGQLKRIEDGQKMEYTSVFTMFLKMRMWYLQKFAETEQILDPPMQEISPLTEAQDEKPQSITFNTLNIITEKDPQMALRAAKAKLREAGYEVTPSKDLTADARKELQIEEVVDGRRGHIN